MYEDMRSPCSCGYEGAAKTVGLLRGRTEMLAQRFDGLPITGLEEAAHRERLLVGAVAVALRAQMGAVLGRRQHEHCPRALPRFLERERSGCFRDAHRH